jgi:uncharacterized protein YaeQ
MIDQQVAGHPGLQDEAMLVEVNDPVLGATGHVAYRGTCEGLDEPRTSHSAQDVGVAQSYVEEPLPEERRAHIADHRLDFGKLGHTSNLRVPALLKARCRRPADYGVTITTPRIMVPWMLQ